MTTTNEQIVSDNSNLQTQASEPKSLSDVSTKTTLSSIGNEPETKTNEAVKKTNDSQAPEIPNKFLNKDGSTNISSLVKSYKELEPLLNEKANWVKEKALLTSQLSKFKTQNVFSDLSKYSIALYEKVLERSSDIEKAKSLIEQLKQNPSEESIKELESLFPSDVVKEVFMEASQSHVSESIEIYKKLQEADFQKAESYLVPIVEKNLEILKNPVAASIFGEVFNNFGPALDSEWFFEKLNQLKEAFILDYQKSQSINKEKDSAVSAAAKLSPNSSTKGGDSLLHRNALDLSPKELDKMLDEYYNR